MATQTVDYGNSKTRGAITWLVYPVCVLVPFAWLCANIDLDTPRMLLPFAFLGLFTAGVMEWIHPHTLTWRKSHGDIFTDLAHQIFSFFLSQFLRGALVFGFFWLLSKPASYFTLITWPTEWPLR